MALAKRAAVLVGSAKPRIAPPLPLRHGLVGFREIAGSMNIELMPWQETAARYLTATDTEGNRLYREVCIVVARQNGKTHLMKPLIVQALRAGKRVMHLAQTRELPRQMFAIIADALEEELFPKRRGKGGKLHTVWPRFGSGSEEIALANGGAYRIAAASRGGSRGFTNDIVIVDELREMETDDVIAATEPTLLTSPDPQMIYLSNAGTEQSVVLNAVRDRAGRDDNLAYLEWSASPERPADDLKGWAEANPALDHISTVMRGLESSYQRHKLAGTLSTFETEHLCRWVVTMRQRLVDAFAWNACAVAELEIPKRSYMAISMDPDGRRASVAVAWRLPDDSIGLRLLLEGTGDPIAIDELGEKVRALATEYRVPEVGYDPMTDAHVAKFTRRSRKIQGVEFANASSRFDLLVRTGKLRYADSDAVTDDLIWTARKEHDESGSFQAVRADDDRPITAALAAIRAVWMASEPKKTVARLY